MLAVIGASLGAAIYISYVTESAAAGIIGGFIVGVVVVFMVNPRDGD